MSNKLKSQEKDENTKLCKEIRDHLKSLNKLKPGKK